MKFVATITLPLLACALIATCSRLCYRLVQYDVHRVDQVMFLVADIITIAAVLAAVYVHELNKG